ncbi:MAG: RNA-directed DNA polymerase [Microgenomates group bacterium Gr01-1014_7]|nr:MAG: RNA-directed DNA polymerase [Microgenomates group bacterium Gr01-1014_7]
MNYADIISIENLFQAWSEFRKGKKKRKDVIIFERNLEDNLFDLQTALKNKVYQHGQYHDFFVHDPKRRHIHKAPVADRIIHHLLYKYLYKLWDKTFIYDSYSCRVGKGTHKGVERLKKFTRKVSQNYTRPCWALKLDIKKFFASVDHSILIELLKKKIKDKDILWLLQKVIQSFPQGIPLGNLTSQVFANIYMNELDQYIKQYIKFTYYIRYADDFVVLSESRETLEKMVDPVSQFIKNSLKLELHPHKIILRNLNWGIDFLGYIVLPHYILPRTKTKKRIFSKLKGKIGDENFNQSLQSYLGYLFHANSFKITEQLKNQIWMWQAEKLL